MSTLALIASLRSKSVKLHLDAGKLKISAPKGAVTPEMLEQIKAHRDAITALLLEARGADRSPIPLREVKSPAQTSFAQQRLWFIDQLEGASATYNMPAALRLSGDVDVAALQASIQSIVDRHETLRTTFATAEGEPLQIIIDHLSVALPVIDSTESELAERVLSFAMKPFDLAHGPLLRVQLLRLGPSAHVLLTNMHHIISDGWSVGVLVGEFVAQYGARVAGREALLPPLPIQYADFAQWQRRSLKGEALQRQQDYWQEQLADLPPLLALPTDRPRPPVQGFTGAMHEFPLPAALAQSLKELAQTHGATLFMILLAAFKVLLARYSGQNDIAVGTPIANRTRPELEGLIGFFVNTLVMRTKVDPKQTFAQLLGEVRATSLAAYEHQDLPFEQLVEAVNPERSLSHSPLFQVVFSMQNTPFGGGELPGLTLAPLESDLTVAKFDLQLDAVDDAEGLRCSLTYRTDLFDAATIKRMAGHYLHLLGSIAKAPDAALTQLSLLDEDERACLRAFNAAPVEFAADACIHTLFEARAAAAPQATAVRFEGRSLSYAELNARANRLAHYLRRQGVGPDTLVGVCLERSAELVVGLLAVLKAGGAYLPIDPECPRERFEYLLADASPRLLVTQQSVRERVPPGAFELVSLDQDNAPWGDMPSDNPVLTTTPHHLAYVIYTSGSTGKPKGVLIEHRQVARLFSATADWFDFGNDDVWTLFHSYAFDFSVWELWGALLHGGALVVVPYWISRSPEDFHTLLRDERVTVLNQTPSAFRSLMRADADSDAATQLRAVIFGGEALDLQSLRPWFERYGDRSPRLINMYGITETTVHVTYRPITLADLDAGRGSVVGRPIPDLQVHLLDSHGQLAPVGVPGEMYVGGAGLARGYLNQPALTAERFIDDGARLIDQDSPTRLYRSGDLARYLPDGELEYLGRIDAQVKIRGFRIELGEIETALTELAEVREAVVITVADDTGDKRLVAYVAGAAGLDAEQVRSGLRARLPEYMVPSYVVLLDALPLTANGKLDRRALPPVDLAGQSRTPYVAPTSDVEQRLAEIWAEVLKREIPIGIHDSFFEIGGHSLLATQLVTRVRQQWGIDLPLRRMFETPTIHEMASYIDMTQGLMADQEAGDAVLEADHEEIEI